MPATGYTRTPLLLKGAVIQFSAPMLVPIPNIIVFQYNPETMSRTLVPWAPAARTVNFSRAEGSDVTDIVRERLDLGGVRALAQPFDPQESITLALELDAADALESPESHPVAFLTGVADRIAALQMLLYPADSGGLSSLNVSVGVSLAGAAAGVTGLLGGATAQLEQREVPVVLFFFGPGLIVPVRLTSFSVEEQQYSPTLYPLRAKVSLGLRVLDEDDLVNAAGVAGPNTAAVELAKGCYQFTQAQRKGLALANLANSVESIVGMLPI